MKKGDIALTPQIAFTGTKATIEAWDGAVLGMEAVSSDTLEKGTYNGAAWEWSSLSAGSVPILDADPVAPDDEQMWILKTPIYSAGTPIGLLMSITQSSITGYTRELSVNDGGTIVRTTMS